MQNEKQEPSEEGNLTYVSFHFRIQFFRQLSTLKESFTLLKSVTEMSLALFMQHFRTASRILKRILWV